MAETGIRDKSGMTGRERTDARIRTVVSALAVHQHQRVAGREIAQLHAGNVALEIRLLRR